MANAERRAEAAQNGLRQAYQELNALKTAQVVLRIQGRAPERQRPPPQTSLQKRLQALVGKEEDSMEEHQEGSMETLLHIGDLSLSPFEVSVQLLDRLCGPEGQQRGEMRALLPLRLYLVDPTRV